MDCGLCWRVKVGVVGASGLVGGALCSLLEKNGYQWVGFSRSPKGRSGEWRSMDEGFVGLDAVVNLAGESIATRWTEENKRRFEESRVGVTGEIVAEFRKLSEGERPQVLVNASAVGYYGDHGGDCLTEASPNGSGYLAELCERWEAAAEKAEGLGIRVVYGRIGVVLAKESEAWRRMKAVSYTHLTLPTTPYV